MFENKLWNLPERGGEEGGLRKEKKEGKKEKEKKKRKRKKKKKEEIPKIHNLSKGLEKLREPSKLMISG